MSKTTLALPQSAESAPARKPAHFATSLQRLQRAIGNLHMQRFVEMKRRAASDPFEAHADRVAESVTGNAPMPSASAGGPVPAALRQPVEAAVGENLSDARVHDDAEAHRIAAGLHANAVTRGNDIYLHRGMHDPRILAHELTHVAQQRGPAAGEMQCDLMETNPTVFGAFEIAMEDRQDPDHEEFMGMQGEIRFVPDPRGPFSAEIGLIQGVSVTDISGETTRASGESVDWAAGDGEERAANDLMTTGTGSAPRGWHIDALTADKDRTSSVGPNYIEQWGIDDSTNYFGHLRSPTDWRAASLYDFPRSWHDVDYEFETVAKATDTQAIYGALHWGFGTRSGSVVDPYAYAADAGSSTFDEALERFRGYYTHEPVVLYFDTNVDTPMAGEAAKVSGFLGYLQRYPDAMLRLEGYADERGSESENVDLSLRRASNVETLLAQLGVDSSRIDIVVGSGKTQQFAAGAAPGQLLANRRVVITFFRTVNTPIVTP